MLKKFILLISSIVLLFVYSNSNADFMGVSDTSGSVSIQVGDGYDPRIVPFTATSDGIVDSIWAFLSTTTSDRHVRLCLYRFSTRAFICSTRVTLSADTTWVVGAVSPASQSITDGVKYFVAITTAGTETDLVAYRKNGSDSLKGFARSGIEPWPSTITVSDVGDASYSILSGISYSISGASPEQPDSLTSVTLDSLHNDNSGDTDLVLVTLILPSQHADSVEVIFNIGGSSWPTFASFDTSLLYAYPDSDADADTIIDTIAVYGVESYTMRVRAYAFNDTATTDTSIHVQDSIYFSSGGGGSCDVGEITDAVMTQIDNRNFVTMSDSPYVKVTTILGDTLPAILTAIANLQSSINDLQTDVNTLLTNTDLANFVTRTQFRSDLSDSLSLINIIMNARLGTVAYMTYSSDYDLATIVDTTGSPYDTLRILQYSHTGGTPGQRPTKVSVIR